MLDPRIEIVKDLVAAIVEHDKYLLNWERWLVENLLFRARSGLAITDNDLMLLRRVRERVSFLREDGSHVDQL